MARGRSTAWESSFIESTRLHIQWTTRFYRISNLTGRKLAWHALIRRGAPNRAGAPDLNNSLTPTRQNVASLDLTRNRLLTYGQIEIGVGIERTDDEISGETSTDGRAFLQWRSSR